MRIPARIRLVLIALVASASALTVLPASAEVDATIAGTGTISPGLTQAGGPQTYTFSGTGGGAGVDNTGTPQAGTFSCAVSGDDTIGTLTSGAGSFSGSCNTPCGTNGVSGSYTRTLSAVSADGSVTSGCFSGSTISIKCHFQATAAPPVVSFSLVCVITW